MRHAAGDVGPNSQQSQSAGISAGNITQDIAGSIVSGGLQREATRALGDKHVASWESIAEGAVGTALGNAAIRGVQGYEADHLTPITIDPAQPDRLSSSDIDFGDTPASAPLMRGDIHAYDGLVGYRGQADYGFGAAASSSSSYRPNGTFSTPDGMGGVYDADSFGSPRQYFVQPEGAYGSAGPTTVKEGPAPFQAFTSVGSDHVTNVQLFDDRSTPTGKLDGDLREDILGAFGDGRNSGYTSASVQDDGVHVGDPVIGELNGRQVVQAYNSNVYPDASYLGDGVFTPPPEALWNFAKMGTGVGDVDVFGQPLKEGEPSRFNLGDKFSDIWRSDDSVLKKLGNTARLSNYEVPDRDERIAQDRAAQAELDARTGPLVPMENSIPYTAGYLLAAAMHKSPEEMARYGEVAQGISGVIGAGALAREGINARASQVGNSAVGSRQQSVGGADRANVPNTTATSIGKSGYASVQEFWMRPIRNIRGSLTKAMRRPSRIFRMEYCASHQGFRSRPCLALERINMPELRCRNG
ncbi:hypothetical protein ABIE56_003703 [Luteibacter sp. 621]|uniref:hypothetical protein n=1 Tax=Luteibacter sp. 621 TaxID=3373916 RepID=UPI003D1D16F5